MGRGPRRSKKSRKKKAKKQLIRHDRIKSEDITQVFFLAGGTDPKCPIVEDRIFGLPKGIQGMFGKHNIFSVNKKEMNIYEYKKHGCDIYIPKDLTNHLIGEDPAHNMGHMVYYMHSFMHNSDGFCDEITEQFLDGSVKLKHKIYFGQIQILVIGILKELDVPKNPRTIYDPLDRKARTKHINCDWRAIIKLKLEMPSIGQYN